MNVVTDEKDELSYLRLELQQQRGMLWLLGEMMKAADSISSFKEIMATLTDMLMGVMGVTTCYLWVKIEDVEVDEYTIFYRSTEFDNAFCELKHSVLPIGLRSLKETIAFSKEKINYPLINGMALPSSRLAVPMFDFEDGKRFGILVVEHEEEQFFSDNTITFFETLSIYIASKALNAKKISYIAEQSIKDPLTGAYNRRYLKTAMDELCQKYDYLTVAIVDTDNFKGINDELGHIEGDIVLKAIARLALGLVEEVNGQVVRYGGDEFVILIPKEQDEALDILEEFRIGVSYLRIAYNLKANVSVTLGVCAYPEMLEECGEALIRAADNALLRGKVKGKNRIVLAESEDMA